MDQAKKILVVDDEEKITDVVRAYLEHDGYQVFTAMDGTSAMHLFDAESPDLVILDLMLPDMTGEDICRAIRSRSHTPVIMLTAKVDEDNIIQGLGIGADDYVCKPFSPRQLMARVDAVLRRVPSEDILSKKIIASYDGRLKIDTDKHEVYKDGENIFLTPAEFQILLLLSRHPSKVFTREEIISNAMGDDFVGYDRTIDTHIKNIRQKIEDDSRQPGYLLTVHGVGYKIASGAK